nr:hypothetical protein [Tanacetum cinerariifolium]
VAADAVEANLVGFTVEGAVVKRLAQLALFADFLHHDPRFVVGQARHRKFFVFLRAAHLHDVS